MKVYGLTGGIGSGKSTVAGLLRALGAEVIDADEVARDVVRVGSEGLSQVVAAFGTKILDADGSLARKALGALVFADADARKRLNAITHPLIATETAHRLQVLRDRGVAIAFYEAALLVENGMQHMLDGLIVVEASDAARRARVRERDGLSDDEVARRFAAQTSNEERRRAADLILVNDGDQATLAAQVRVVWERLEKGGSLRVPAP